MTFERRPAHPRANGGGMSEPTAATPGKRTLTEDLLPGPAAPVVVPRVTGAAQGASPLAARPAQFERLFGRPAPASHALEQQAGPAGDREPELRRSAQATGPATAPPIVDDVLRGGGGAPLDAATRAQMEASFGHDFSGVRVHTGARAASASQAVGAQAFAVGSDVVFGAGQYDPSSARGQHLLAHELTHVVQQGGPRRTGGVPDTAPDGGGGSAAERLATLVW